MGGRVSRAVSYRSLIDLRAEGWRVERVAFARTFVERLLGLHVAGAEALLIHASSVHGKGLTDPLRVVHLSRSGMVLGDERLEVDGSVRSRGYWMLELPLRVPSPRTGVRIGVLPSSPR